MAPPPGICALVCSPPREDELDQVTHFWSTAWDKRDEMLHPILDSKRLYFYLALSFAHSDEVSCHLKLPYGEAHVGRTEGTSRNHLSNHWQGPHFNDWGEAESCEWPTEWAQEPPAPRSRSGDHSCSTCLDYGLVRDLSQRTHLSCQSTCDPQKLEKTSVFSVKPVDVHTPTAATASKQEHSLPLTHPYSGANALLLQIIRTFLQLQNTLRPEAYFLIFLFM